MSMSTSVIPRIEEVEGFDSNQLIDYLKIIVSGLNEDEAQKLRDEGVTGCNLLELNCSFLKECGIRLGPRASLVKLIKNLKKQSKFYCK